MSTIVSTIAFFGMIVYLVGAFGLVRAALLFQGRNGWLCSGFSRLLRYPWGSQYSIGDWPGSTALPCWWESASSASRLL